MVRTKIKPGTKELSFQNNKKYLFGTDLRCQGLIAVDHILRTLSAWTEEALAPLVAGAGFDATSAVVVVATCWPEFEARFATLGLMSKLSRGNSTKVVNLCVDVAL